MTDTTPNSADATTLSDDPAQAGDPASKPTLLPDGLTGQTSPPATPTPAGLSNGGITDAAFEENIVDFLVSQQPAQTSKTDARKYEMILAAEDLAKHASAVLGDLAFLVLDAPEMPDEKFRENVRDATVDLARMLRRYVNNRQEFVSSDQDGLVDAEMFEVSKIEADQDRAKGMTPLWSSLTIPNLQKDIRKVFDELGVEELAFDATPWRLIGHD